MSSDFQLKRPYSCISRRKTMTMHNHWHCLLLCVICSALPTAFASSSSTVSKQLQQVAPLPAPPYPFNLPQSEALDHVNLIIGNGGDTPNGSGGMIPSTGEPWGMTRWVGVNQVNYVSATPFNHTKYTYMGVQATRQPAIWMGESASVGVVPGVVRVEGNLDDSFDSSKVVVDFEKRGLKVKTDANGEKKEVTSVGYYAVELELPTPEDGQGSGGGVKVEQTSTSRVAHLRFTYTLSSLSSSLHQIPYLLFEIARPSIITSTPTNITYPPGSVSVSRRRHRKGTSDLTDIEICGYSSERQDWIITPISTAGHAQHFKGYVCARFDSVVVQDSDGSSSPVDFSFGIIQNQTRIYPLDVDAATNNAIEGPLLSAFVAFNPAPTGTKDKTITVTLRVGTSFISQDQAKRNIDIEIPDASSSSSSDDMGAEFNQNQASPSREAGIDSDADTGGDLDEQPNAKQSLHLTPSTFENTAFKVRSAWADLLERIEVKVYADENSDDAMRPLEERERDEVDLRVFWTGVVHTLQYPNEQHEHGRYYSGYDDTVHEGESYTGYSIWDTYRAQWAWQILFTPEKIPGMVRSMLQDYQQSGWLPMWKNIVETNIMVGTHADSLIAEAVLKLKGTRGFDEQLDLDLAWEAVWKDATVPPVRDWEVRYEDREENVDYEVRAGLSSVYDTHGWVADDVHSESASRTLDYAYDDYAAYVLARELNKSDETMSFLLERALMSPFTLFNDETGFMEARNKDGGWAGEGSGWTEGDKWAYSFDVIHDVGGLVARRGGRENFVRSLDEHFDGGHNDHTNEPSHHIPYLYAMAGAAWKTQERVREIALSDYKDGPEGLSGNEDCGQMSAWFIFTAMGFYPVNPVSGEYTVGSPLFESLTLHIPNASKPLHISALGARTKKYVKSLTINGQHVLTPVIKHEWIKDGGEVVFEMSAEVEAWGGEEGLMRAFGVGWEDGWEAEEVRDEL
ncbi:glycosyl hydrolase family 92-domain-containing protein [Panaeolus papilionaceus]|nr:glycosyl hydrolase family 92-domain-containing protein [Panaeolus papilionaceus]